jgi:fumarylpyruvate hydrolase
VGQIRQFAGAFDQSAPIASLDRVNGGRHPDAGRIWLAVNGAVKQDANLTELIWPVPDIVSILSRSMALKPGDLIMTGTPAGIGAIVAGDKVTGGIDDLGEIDVTVGQAIVRHSTATNIPRSGI